MTKIETFIEEIISDLIKIYSNYNFYSESDIVFVIKNIILKYDNYKTVCNKYYIFDEFPIRLKYPRTVTNAVIEKNPEIKEYYKETPISSPKKIIPNYKENVESLHRNGNIKGDDVGVVGVDLAIIERLRYLNLIDFNSQTDDKKITGHKYVIELKFEKDLCRKLKVTDTTGNNKEKYLRKDLNNKNNTNFKSDFQKDIEKIDAIIEDEIADCGYFIFISEGGHFLNYFQKDNKHGFIVNEDSIEKTPKGFIYIYKNGNGTIYGKTIPLKNSKS